MIKPMQWTSSAHLLPVSVPLIWLSGLVRIVLCFVQKV
jgi:hypothetical protein